MIVVIHSGPHTRAYTAKLLVLNPCEKRIAFKLKTIEPKRYVVRPGKGFLDPKKSTIVNIRLKPIANPGTFQVARQKFMVQAMIAEKGNNAMALVCIAFPLDTVYI